MRPARIFITGLIGTASLHAAALAAPATPTARGQKDTFAQCHDATRKSEADFFQRGILPDYTSLMKNGCAPFFTGSKTEHSGHKKNQPPAYEHRDFGTRNDEKCEDFGAMSSC